MELFQLDLLKTEALAPLNRLEGALDAAEITESNLLLLGVKTVSIESNSGDDCYCCCYSDLSPCFSGLGYCRNSNLLMLVLLIMRILFNSVAGADLE